MSNYIKFGFIDELAKPASSPTSNDKQDFVNMSDLKDTLSASPKIVSFEKNFWKLDGTYLFVDDESVGKKGYISHSMSDSEGYFSPPVTLTINFSLVVETVGLTINMYPTNIISDMTIKLYLGATLVHTENIYNNKSSNVVFSANQALNFDRAELIFYKTETPYRFVKIYNIEYGVGRIFNMGEDIVSASVDNGVSLISSEAIVSTLQFSIHSEDAEFSILNPTGLYALLKDKQRFDVFYKDALYGAFYLKDWETLDNYNYNFTAEDAIGVMAGVKFDGGMYTDKNAVELITEICNVAGFDVDIKSTSIIGKTVSGWIPISDCRSALQQVLFATKTTVSTQYTDKVVIKDLAANTEVKEITNEDIYQGEKLRLRPLVTQVILTEHNYMLEPTQETQEIYNGMLKAGSNRLEFNEPHHNYSVSYGTITDSGANYVVIKLDSDGSVVITAQKYIDNKKVLSEVLPKFVKSNIITIDNAYLVNKDNSTDVLNYVFDFYQNRIERTLNYDYNDNGTVGDLIQIETIFGELRPCIFENIELDLVSEDAKGVAIIYGE